MTETPTFLRGLEDIADRYDAVLCDVWGVVHNGKRAYEEACRALEMFRRTRGPVILVTNAPVPKARVTRLFPRLGVPDACFDDVVSSGEVTRLALARHAQGRVYRIGVEEDASLYEGTPLVFTDDPDQASVVCCTGLRAFSDTHPDDYLEELAQLKARDLPFICANPDRQFPYGGRLIWAAGALADRYEGMGGEVLRAGKPDAAIYEASLSLVRDRVGATPHPSRILAIGDGAPTDIIGANRQGFDALFIGDGLHAASLPAGDDDPAAIGAWLAREGASAAWYASRLAW